MPLSRRARITGFTSPPFKTKSPVIAALPPPVGWKLIAVASPMDGGTSTPSAVIVSARGTPTWYTPPSMGLATAINFQPTGAGKAAITGDFVLLGNEVNPVIRALRDNGIAITALHSHMLTDSPHLFFMHYWANDDALK